MARREPNGRTKREPAAKRDEGTALLRARRELLAGGGDPAKTSYPLGVLLVNDAITEAQHRAGCRYAWMYGLIFGKVSIAAANYDGAPRGGGAEIELDKLEEWQRRLDAARWLLGERARTEVEEIVLFERMPNWMRPTVPTHADVESARRVVHALQKLAEQMGDARPAEKTA